MSKRIEKIFYDEISVGFKVAFSIDGKILIRETICLWNISKIPKQSIFFHNIDSGDGNNVLLTNNKKYLGLSSSQGLKIFNTEKNQIEFILSEFKENVYDVWIAQEIYLITLGDRNLSVFNLKTNDIIFSFINNKGQNLRFLVSHDLFAIFYTNDTFCSVWSIIENIRVFDINRGNIRILHSSFIKNSRSLVFIFEDRYIGIWNIDSECEEYSLKDQYKSIHKIYYLIDQKSFIIDVINNNSKRVAYFWNFQGNSEELPIYSYKFIWINQKYIITDNNNILTIWNIKGKFKEFEVDYQTKPENISYNGKFLFMIYNTHSDIWKIQDYLKLQLNNLYKLNVPIFSSNDKKYVVSGDENFLKLWNLEQGKEILSFKAHENWIRTLAFSHDNKFIVSGDDNGSVKIWDLKGKNIQCFKGHSSWVVAASFSRNGRFVVSGSNDRIVLVWEVGRDEELKAFEVYQEAIHSVSITDNGKFIAVESIKGDLRVLKG